VDTVAGREGWGREEWDSATDFLRQRLFYD
jgi:hypothetical protein